MSANRFSAAVLEELERAGWARGRVYDISAWVDELGAQGYRLSTVAADGLKEFGGLELGPVEITGPNFSNDEPLTVDPILAGSGHYELADELHRELGGDWYPFGEWLSYSSVFVNAQGWTVATGMGWIWEVGSSIDDAIEFALTANHPLRCLKVLTPGGKPWPEPESDG